jgi:hypothetical protein
MERRPKGYVGRGHETIGSDILSILQVARLPESVLGKELAQKLKAVHMNDWYPITLLLEPLEILAKQLGDNALPAIGIKLFQLSHEEAVKKAAHNVADILYGFDAMYHRANRGEAIGGWGVLSFAPGEASLEKTTPHHCRMEEGIMRQALIAVGVPATVSQTKCFRKGDETCVFHVQSFVAGERWGAAR